MIPYVEINNEHETAQLLTVGRSSATKHARGNGIVSDTIARCGAAELWRCWQWAQANNSVCSAPVSEARVGGNTPFIKTNGSLSRAPACGATYPLLEKRP
jgi:hypothetical protein